MGARAEGKASESGVAGEWEWENGGRIPKIVMKWRGRSWMRIGGFIVEGGSGWGCGQGPSGYS